MDGRDIKWLAVILLIAAVVVAGWYYRDQLVPPPAEPVTAPPAPPPEEPAETGEPMHPITPVGGATSEPRELVPLPPLDDSDAYFVLELVDALGADVETLLIKEGIIDRFVATIDNLPRGHVAEKIRPVGRLAEPFRVEAAVENGPIYLSSENYRRYDPLVTRIAAMDIDAVTDAYRRFYPLFQQSYERLGYPDSYFNDRLIEVIDHLLTTPEPDEPVRLVRPGVLYEFADRELEALSSGQKLLLRLGPENAATVKRKLREMREALARQ